LSQKIYYKASKRRGPRGDRFPGEGHTPIRKNSLYPDSIGESEEEFQIPQEIDGEVRDPS